MICAKVQNHYPDFVHGAGRLTTPLRRVGAKGEGRFERISWAEALDRIHDRVSLAIAEHGPQSVLPLNYAGPHGFVAGGSMDLRFFHRLGASLLDRRPLCGGIRSEAWMGTYGAAPGIRPEQVVHSRLFIAWGNNVTWSNLPPGAGGQRRPGGAGPRWWWSTPSAPRSPSSATCTSRCARAPTWCWRGRWPPSSSAAAASTAPSSPSTWTASRTFMAEARRWTVAAAARECAVPEAQIRQLAEWYHTISPAAIAVGNGLERNQNGGSGVRAVFALPALAGKWGVPGGGLVNGAGHVFVKTPAKLAAARLRPGRHAHPQHHRRRAATCSTPTCRRRSRRCSSTTTTR